MAVRAIMVICLGGLMMAGSGESADAQPAGHITGVGGVFFKAKDPKALAAWYRDVLGMPVEAWGGAALRYDAPKHPPALAWSAFTLLGCLIALSANQIDKPNGSDYNSRRE